jgi:hypothetical protein
MDGMHRGVVTVLTTAFVAVAALLAGRAALDTRAGTEALSARERLLWLAGAAQAAGGDGGGGRYSRIHLQRTARSVRIDSERWRGPDGSGRLAERRLGTPGAPVVRTDYPPGSLRLRTGEPFPTDPAALVTALTRGQPGDGPTAVVTGLLDTIGIRYLDRAERAATLRALAGLPGLAFAGAGPHGLEFTVAVGDERLRLDVDGATGEVTGWEWGDAERVEILGRARADGLAPGD